jgi:hypothetical protein
VPAGLPDRYADRQDGNAHGSSLSRCRSSGRAVADAVGAASAEGGQAGLACRTVGSGAVGIQNKSNSRAESEEDLLGTGLALELSSAPSAIG